MAKFLNQTGVKTLLNKIKEVFASNEETSVFIENTTNYVTDVDYNKLAFNKDWIIGSGAASVVGEAIVGSTALN